jgi:hypothetical protein
MRTAETVAQELYDERDETGALRDLEPHEQALLTEVHRIANDCARTISEAARALGEESKATLAIRFSAHKRRDERFAAALKKYDSAVNNFELIC